MKFRMSSHSSLKWPNRCVYCGGEATTSCTVYGQSYYGIAFVLFGIGLKYRKMPLTYPVCRKHKYWIKALRINYFVSFIGILLGGPIVGGLVGVEAGVAAFLFFVLAFVASVILPPIKLRDIGEHYFTLIIRNEVYASEFAFYNVNRTIDGDTLQ